MADTGHQFSSSRCAAAQNYHVHCLINSPFPQSCDNPLYLQLDGTQQYAHLHHTTQKLAQCRYRRGAGTSAYFFPLCHIWFSNFTFTFQSIDHWTMNTKNTQNMFWIITKIQLVPCGTDGPLLLSGFQALVTLTLTSDRVIWHTVVHHSSTSIYKPNFIEIGKTFCGRTDVPTDGHF